MAEIADQRERVLQEPRRLLARVRQDAGTWEELAFRAEARGERVSDRNARVRFGVLLAAQFDRRPGDLELLRFLLREQTTSYREAVGWGMGADLELAGFLVAEYGRPEDLWLHWEAKHLSFDTALGYHLFYLLAGGVAAGKEMVRASSHPDRDWLLSDIAASGATDVAVAEWLAGRRVRFPADPAEEDLKAWAYHAAALGEREASRRFMTGWAAGEPRTGRTLNSLQFHLAGLGYLDEAIAAQRESVAICDAPPGSSLPASELLTLARLERRAGRFTEARGTLHAAGDALTALPGWPWAGMWQSFVRELLLLVPAAPDDRTARRVLAEADRYLGEAPEDWLRGVRDAVTEAARHMGDDELAERYQAPPPSRPSSPPVMP